MTKSDDFRHCAQWHMQKLIEAQNKKIDASDCGKRTFWEGQQMAHSDSAAYFYDLAAHAEGIELPLPTNWYKSLTEPERE